MGEIDLNAAGLADLVSVPGIGEKTASAILALRRSRGRFSDARELLDVKGIGAKKLERIRPYLVLSDPDVALVPR